MKFKKVLAWRAGKLTLSPRSPGAVSQPPPPPPPPPELNPNLSPLLDFRFTLPFKFILIALVFLLLSAAPVSAQTTHDVASVSEWQTAMDNAVTNDIINITASFTLSSDLASLFAVVTIQGNNFTIDGGGQFAAIIVGNNSAGGTINNLTLANNKGGAGTHGGAIQYQNGSSLTLNNVTIRNSRSSSGTADGGGLQCQRPNLTIRNSRIHDNSGRKGGGLNLDNGCTGAQIINSSIYDNESTGNGAGIHVDGGASVTISNSSIYGNSSAHRGGGIYMDGGGTLTLNHVTIAGNSTTDAQGSASSDTGAGLRMYSGTLHIRHSIIYGNTLKGNQENCRLHSAVTVGTLSNNMIGGGSDTTCTPNSDPADPLLVGPDVHGRGNFFIPRQGSSAIDSIGNADCLSTVTTDQRGQPRPYPTGGNCDKGAIEDPGYVPPPPPSPPPSDDEVGDDDDDDDDDETLKAVLAAPVSTCLTLDGIAASNLTESTQCQRLDAMQIANPDIKEGDFVDAVDVWSWVQPNTEICFEALGGSVTFIDTAAMPRTAHKPEAYSKDGMTCAKVDGPGILVLMTGDRPALAAADSASKAAKAAPAAQSLSNCMVRTQFNLNFRAAPDGEIVGEVPHNATLTALERTAAWFKVDYHGERGWISAEYVDKKGTCG